MKHPLLARILPAALVLAALIPWAWLAISQRDLPQFGKYQDDGLFLIAAKSLREGGGYRISSLPGQPFQTKYQPLYPALLALFDGSLETAALLQWGILTGYFLLAFALARSFGFAPWKCALMLLMLTINPWLLYWGLLPISDFLFASLVLAVFLLPRNWSAAIGIAAAAASLTKVAGVLLVPALWASAGWR